MKIRNLRFILTFFLQIILVPLFGQNKIIFNEPLKIVAKEKINNYVKKGDILFATAITNSGNGYPYISLITKNSNGEIFNIDPIKIDLFEFEDIDNCEKVWDKQLLISGGLSSILTKGLQYEIRNDLINESIDYVNTLNINNRFLKDDYLEDYIYTLINKIHSGILNNNRPGNLYVKILKDKKPNAFSLSNGCIIISTGLLSTIQSEDELIGILAHEIAHFVLDHHILNYNKEVDRIKRAEFWTSFATTIAASADAYMTINNKNHIPGVLTTSTIAVSSLFSEIIINRLGLKYSQNQESEADKVSLEILDILKYNKKGLSAALQRIRNYNLKTGNLLSLTGNGTHPSLDSRIETLGKVINLDSFIQSSFLRKVSFVNSYNAWIELWYYSNHLYVNELSSRNIINGVASESDYIVKAVVQRRLYNTPKSNEEVINLLNKAKTLNVTPYILINKEEGLTYIRLNKKEDAKKAFINYLNTLNDLINRKEPTDLKILEDEISWTKLMIYKIDKI